MNTSVRIRSSRVGRYLRLWLVASLVIGALGLLRHSPVPPPAIALILTAALLALIWRSATVRNEIRARGLRPLVAIHLVRLPVGAYFLFLHEVGALPAAFAVPAGWGDIIVAVAAIPVLIWCIPARTNWQLGGLLLWNAVGLVDILGVLARAAGILLDDAGALALFARLPLALLPTFVVPLIIVTHVLLFVWARGRHEPDGTTTPAMAMQVERRAG